MDHEQLVDQLVAEGVLKTPVIIAAFRAIDRADFVPLEHAAEAYGNYPLPLAAGQTISQPWTVAFMLERLAPQPGDNVLDVGSGSGWQTALLAHMVGEAGHVTALEIVPELCEMGQRNVEKYGFIESGQVEMHCMSGRGGYAARVPFHKIVAAAAGVDVPEAWQTQLLPGGSIVTPVGSSILRLTKSDEGTWQREEFPGFAFVPLVA